MSVSIQILAPASSTIAFLGTGAMGLPMARRLCRAGWRLRVWNRTSHKAQALAADGAIVCDAASEAVRGADAIIGMLENGQVVQQVLFGQGGAAQAMQRGALWIDMASIAPHEACGHASSLQARGVQALDAPVSGGVVGAEQGVLSIMAGGAAIDVRRAQPLLAVLGRITHVGPTGSGQLAKLANQMIVGATIGAVAEALLLCAKGGADMGKVREALMGGFADSRILTLHGERMVQRDFAKRARMEVQRKDMRNAMQTAAALGCDLPIAHLVAQLYAEAVTHGLAELDHSGLFVELARRNGLE